MNPKYRVGRKQGRAILEIETGKEFLLFPVGREEDAQEYCDYLNYKKDKVDEYISSELGKYMRFAFVLGAAISWEIMVVIPSLFNFKF